MLEAQYSNQGPISDRDLRGIAQQIGMKPDVLMSKVSNQSYRDYVLQQRQRAVEIGVNSTPTVLINGHFVASRTEECMTQFVQQAKNGDLAAAGR
jgi:predicted DsbA family dithiol-disulfide isomerase